MRRESSGLLLENRLQQDDDGKQRKRNDMICSSVNVIRFKQPWKEQRTAKEAGAGGTDAAAERQI